LKIKRVPSSFPGRFCCCHVVATIMAALRDSWQVQMVVRAYCLPRVLPPTALSCTRLAPCKATPPPPTRTPVHTFVRHEQRAVRHVGSHGADVQAPLRCLSMLQAARSSLTPVPLHAGRRAGPRSGRPQLRRQQLCARCCSRHIGRRRRPHLHPVAAATAAVQPVTPRRSTPPSPATRTCCTPCAPSTTAGRNLPSPPSP
jgi:hypothetical protein